MSDERSKFGARLRAAMRDAGIEESGTVLMKRFNARYRGVSVTSQTASAWMAGKVLPRMDKLPALADLLGVGLEFLLTGKKARRVGEGQAPTWPDRANSEEKAAIDAFLDLPAEQRELIGKLINALAAGQGLR